MPPTCGAIGTASMHRACPRNVHKPPRVTRQRWWRVACSGCAVETAVHEHAELWVAMDGGLEGTKHEVWWDGGQRRDLTHRVVEGRGNIFTGYYWKYTTGFLATKYNGIMYNDATRLNRVQRCHSIEVHATGDRLNRGLNQDPQPNDGKVPGGAGGVRAGVRRLGTRRTVATSGGTEERGVNGRSEIQDELTAPRCRSHFHTALDKFTAWSNRQSIGDTHRSKKADDAIGTNETRLTLAHSVEIEQRQID
ncbi:hypothetical protein DFH09DRAFT_1070369 [Mycena vulgaris]|nr:hypothetical protein DFH09DRAFT_1070369 [Mycena vulgaris]